jgi:ribonuclease P protein component
VHGSARFNQFPRQARLTRGVEYRGVFANAQRHADRYFTILVAPCDTGSVRLGLAVSKRSTPRAVDRNRLKRLIRETFRHQRQNLPGADIVVMVRPIACHTNNATLTTALDRLWQRISKQCEPF